MTFEEWLAQNGYRYREGDDSAVRVSGDAGASPGVMEKEQHHVNRS